MRGVGVEELPERSVSGPRQRFVAVPPRGPEPDPHRGPVGGAVPCPALLGDQAVADLELRTTTVEAVGCGADRPHPHVQRHQLQLEVLERPGSTRTVATFSCGARLMAGKVNRTGDPRQGASPRGPDVDPRTPTSGPREARRRRGSVASEAAGETSSRTSTSSGMAGPPGWAPSIVVSSMLHDDPRCLRGGGGPGAPTRWCHVNRCQRVDSSKARASTLTHDHHEDDLLAAPHDRDRPDGGVADDRRADHPRARPGAVKR